MIARRLAAAAILALGMGALAIPRSAGAAGYPLTSYSFTSAPGEYIGGGLSATYTPANATIRLSGDAGYPIVSVTTSTDWWYIVFAAPSGDLLHPGTYEGVERAAFHTGRAAGMDVIGDGRSCNDVYGSFAINQIATDPRGSVTRLDATFTQYCESATAPALTGTVLYNAAPLSYSFSSDPGDYIGQGQARAYTGATSLFILSGTPEGVTFIVSGLRDQWTIQLAPPRGKRLTPGTYANAERAPFRTGNHPGLDVFGDGRVCDSVSGTFTITTLETNGGGDVNRLDGTFVQYCDGATSGLYGTVHMSSLHSAAAYTVPLPTAPGSAVVRTTLSLNSTTGDPIGQGNTASYAPPAAVFKVSGDSADLTVAVTTSTEAWSLELAAPLGERLHPGFYNNAERARWRTGRSPGLDLSVNGQVCNGVYGSFVLNQIGADLKGRISTLDATFTQNCGSSDASPLRGTILYNASPLSYEYSSDAGDAIGQGSAGIYAGAIATFDMQGDSTGFTYSVSGLRDAWTIQLAAPRLKTGTYTSGFSVSGDGRGCGTYAGTLTISDVRFDTSGALTALKASFVQHCDGAAPAMRGTIDFNA